MSIKDYNLAKKKMNQFPDMMHFIGSRPEELVVKAEDILNLQFPPAYRSFLLDFGAGDFGTEGILGVINDDYFNSGNPDGIWFTIQQRKIGLPICYVAIYDVGDGDIFCLDTTQKDDAMVVTYQPGYPLEQQRREIIAPNFGAFFLDLVTRQISQWLRKETSP